MNDFVNKNRGNFPLPLFNNHLISHFAKLVASANDTIFCKNINDFFVILNIYHTAFPISGEAKGGTFIKLLMDGC